MPSLPLIDRPIVTDWLARWKDRDVIKVVTGIRRCGKSTALTLFQQKIAAQFDHQAPSIIAVDIEKMGFDAPSNAKELYDLVANQLTGARTYIFLDEVQRVPEFEKAVDALYARDDTDLYITGSNSDLLSSEIATLLTGRYVELRLLPLSFSEYVSAAPSTADMEALFNRYLIHGGMPYAAALPESDTAEYLDGVLSTILVKDVSLRHPRFDMSLLRTLAAFMADNIGNAYSLGKIANALSQKGIKISPTSVKEYLDALTESYVLFKAEPFDVKGKAILHTGGKYYLGDLGFRHLLRGRDQEDLGHRVENVVYLELLRRFSKVRVGRIGGAEIDFIAENEHGPHYFQVSLSVLDPDTLARELRPLRSVPDNYPKTLLTLDKIGVGTHDGIMQEYLIDWLL